MGKLKIGFENEFFLVDENQTPVIIPEDISSDECGLLVEVRSDPSEDIYKALFSLKCEETRIEDTLRYKYPKLTMVDEPIMVIPKEVKLAVRRKFIKGLISYQNMYNFKTHRNTQNEQTAGMHISFTYPKKETFYLSKCDKCNNTEIKEVVNNQIFDYIQIFKALDKEFAEEIRTAKRNQGFYEIKDDGRIEYRSLPNNIEKTKLLEVLNKILK